MSSLVYKIHEYKVSSVLNNDRKVYGKKFLFDGKEETCWNSDQGSPQWVHFSFSSPVTITAIKLQFQGGFAGKECELGVLDHDRGDPDQDQPRTSAFHFSAEDNNSLQDFNLRDPLTGTHFYLNLTSSTDFYGRIILYNFDILGNVK